MLSAEAREDLEFRKLVLSEALERLEKGGFLHGWGTGRATCSVGAINLVLGRERSTREHHPAIKDLAAQMVPHAAETPRYVDHVVNYNDGHTGDTVKSKFRDAIAGIQCVLDRDDEERHAGAADSSAWTGQ